VSYLRTFIVASDPTDERKVMLCKVQATSVIILVKIILIIAIRNIRKIIMSKKVRTAVTRNKNGGNSLKLSVIISQPLGKSAVADSIYFYRW
jgi:hypothetical protein